jgi:hypothetical protein
MPSDSGLGVRYTSSHLLPLRCVVVHPRLVCPVRYHLLSRSCVTLVGAYPLPAIVAYCTWTLRQPMWYWIGPDRAAGVQLLPSGDLRWTRARSCVPSNAHGLPFPFCWLWRAFLCSSLPSALVIDFGCSVQVRAAELALAVLAFLVFVEV